MKTKKTILVTGGTGLVGSALKNIHLLPEYSSKYDFHFVSSKQYDLLDLNQTLYMFNEIKPHIVIHLAAFVGGLYKNMNKKVEMFENNLTINHNVIRSAHLFGVEKLIACLSTCIFPDKTTYPINEECLHNGPPHHSNDAYAYAKRMLEFQCRLYRENYHEKFVCIIPTNIYGEYDNYHLEDAHVIPALIHKCFLAKQKDQPFTVLGSGKPLRQFIYSIDLAKLIMVVVETFEQDNIILSTDVEVSIEDVAREIATFFGMEDRICFDRSFSDGQFKKTADNSKLMKLLADNHYPFEFTSIKEGIHKSCVWFQENYDKNIRL
jgi:GDP-L-fucose synthase